MKVRGALLSITLLAGYAGAATVTFDSFSPLDTCLTTASSEGLTFTGGDCISNFMYVWDGSAPNGNGTPALIYGFNNSVAITLTGGGVFSLQDFQMAISFYDSNPSEAITLTEHFQGGGSNSEAITLIQGLQTYDLNFSNLTELDIGAVPSATGYWLLDNIDFNGSAVPEPGTFAMLGSGLLVGFGLLRRKRRQ